MLRDLVAGHVDIGLLHPTMTEYALASYPEWGLHQLPLKPEVAKYPVLSQKNQSIFAAPTSRKDLADAVNAQISEIWTDCSNVKVMSAYGLGDLSWFEPPADNYRTGVTVQRIGPRQRLPRNASRSNRDPGRLLSSGRPGRTSCQGPSCADALPDMLSGGQQQRVAIARIMAMRPKLILFDEPTSGLDPELVGKVLAVIRDLARQGMTVLIVTHEIRFAAKIADRILFMDKGRIALDGTPREILIDGATERVRQFLRSMRTDLAASTEPNLYGSEAAIIKAQSGLDFRAAENIRFGVLNADAIRHLEPHLAPISRAACCFQGIAN